MQRMLIGVMALCALALPTAALTNDEGSELNKHHSLVADILQHGVTIGAPVANGKFKTLREPSGITALDAKTLMVVEDEATRALQRLTVSSGDPATFAFQETSQPPARNLVQRLLIAPLDDLEGIARVSSSLFFIIGSHENAYKGTMPAREKILLLTREDDGIVSTAMRTDLFDEMTRRYPQLAEIVSGSKKGDNDALNIEAIAFDRKRKVLHIGLRTPLLGKDAIIVSLTNAVDYLEGAEPEFADSLKGIDLDKNGIRAMAYDDQSDALLIVSKRESGGNNRSSLWALSATMNQEPVRYKSDDKNLFRDVEGLTPIDGGVMFVRDNGGKTKKGDDQWFILERSQLGFG